MKFKLFLEYEGYLDNLISNLNDFANTHEIIDFRYAISRSEQHNCNAHYVLVMYSEERKHANYSTNSAGFFEKDLFNKIIN